MRIKTQLNSILAIITAIVVTMSSSLVSINILAADTTDYIVNGDFENGNLEGYIYTYGEENSAATDAIRVVNSDGNHKAYIPPRDNSVGGANGRFINQSVTLPAGSYRLSFDADIIFTDVSDSQPFIFTVSDNIDTFERALDSIEGSSALCLETFSGLNTPEIKNWGDAAGNAFAVKPVSAGNHVGGKLAVDFTLESEQKVYISIGINANTASAYIDNLEIIKINKQATGFLNGDFETGDLTGYIYTYGIDNPSASDTIKVVDKEGDYKAYIPPRDNSVGGANGRFINQSVTLPAGSYRLSFDADIIFTDVSDSQPFIFTVSDNIDTFERALDSIEGSSALCLETFSGLNTPEIKNWGDAAGNAFAVKPVSAGNHVGGKLAVDFTLESEQKVYISIGVNGVNASAYIDNIKLTQGSSLNINIKSFTGLGNIQDDTVLSIYKETEDRELYMQINFGIGNSVNNKTIYIDNGTYNFVISKSGHKIKYINNVVLNNEVYQENYFLELLGNDVNNDNKIDIRDLIRSKKFASGGLSDILEEDKKLFDHNNDNIIGNAEDIAVLRWKILNDVDCVVND